MKLSCIGCVKLSSLFIYSILFYTILGAACLSSWCGNCLAQR